MDTSEELLKFQRDNPQLKQEQIEALVKIVAKDCMYAIVKNVEFNGRGENGWWTIKESFDVDVDNEILLLPLNRSQDAKVNSDFSNACSMGDIEKIKEGLENFARINIDQDSSYVRNAVITGNLKTLKFFVEDDFINKNSVYKDQVYFEGTKGVLFEDAFFFKQKEILEYLIVEHNAEMTDEAKKILKNDDSEFKKEVMKIIENKFLKYLLDIQLKESVENKQKLKI